MCLKAFEKHTHIGDVIIIMSQICDYTVVGSSLRLNSKLVEFCSLGAEIWFEGHFQAADDQFQISRVKTN